jgi:hypothetical protein
MMTETRTIAAVPTTAPNAPMLPEAVAALPTVHDATAGAVLTAEPTLVTIAQSPRKVAKGKMSVKNAPTRPLETPEISAPAPVARFAHVNSGAGNNGGEIGRCLRWLAVRLLQSVSGKEGWCGHKRWTSSRYGCGFAGGQSVTGQSILSGNGWVEGKMAWVSLPGLVCRQRVRVFRNFVLLNQSLHPVIKHLFMPRPCAGRFGNHRKQNRQYFAADSVTQIRAACAVNQAGIARSQAVFGQISVRRIAFQLCQVRPNREDFRWRRRLE